MKKFIFLSILILVATCIAYADIFSTGPYGTGTIFSCSGSMNPLCTDSIGKEKAYQYPNGNKIVDLPEYTYRLLPE